LDCGLSIGVVHGKRPISRASLRVSPAVGRAVVRQPLDRRRQAIHQPEAALDALDHQVADVAAVDAAGRRHPEDRLAIAAVEREGDAHPLAVVAADLKPVGAPAAIRPVERLDMTLAEVLKRQPIQWHGVRLNAPDFSYESHSLAGTIRLLGYPLQLHMITNAYWEALEFELPPLEAAQET
jgi:hypothetical protein